MLPRRLYLGEYTRCRCLLHQDSARSDPCRTLTQTTSISMQATSAPGTRWPHRDPVLRASPHRGLPCMRRRESRELCTTETYINCPYSAVRRLAYTISCAMHRVPFSRCSDPDNGLANLCVLQARPRFFLTTDGLPEGGRRARDI